MHGYFYLMERNFITLFTFMQLLYILIIGATYYFIATSSFRYIPGYYLSGVHRYHTYPYAWCFVHGCVYLTWDMCTNRYTSFLAVGVGLFLFAFTSFSDPGVVNSDNVSQYLSVYPYDNIIFSEKECPTCKIPKWDHLSGFLLFRTFVTVWTVIN